VHRRKAPNHVSVTVLDIVLGWTFVGWVVALVLAFRDVPQVTAPPQQPLAAQPPPRNRSRPAVMTRGIPARASHHRSATHTSSEAELIFGLGTADR
jgi:hypothetical protein